MPKQPAKKIAQALISQPWAITEGALRLMLDIAMRQDLDLAAVEARKAERLSETSGVGLRDGVAIVPVIGPIARYMNLFSDISGGTSIQTLARDFQTALNNNAVKAILLNIDSPGGDVNGINEFTNMVHAARGVKPITAYVGGTGASAAYWIASAADEIVVDETALIGSIGVIAALPADAGEDVVFVSSQSPKKRPDPATEEGAADIQSIIDATAQVFVESVARNRNVSVETVLSNYGAGGLFVGKDAVSAGLADRLGSFEATLAGMTQGAGQASARAISHSAAPPIVSHAALSVSASVKGGVVTTSPVRFTPDKAQPFPTAITALHTPGGARTHTQPKRTQEKHMPDDVIEERVDIAPPPVLPDSAPAAAVTQALEGIGEQLTAKQTQLLQAQWAAMQEQANRQAEERFARWAAEQEQRTRLLTFAQDIVTASVQHSFAYSATAEEVFTLLSETNAAVQPKWMAFLKRQRDAGFVSFEEIGSEGSEATAQDVTERWNERVNAEVAKGKARSAAIEAVMKAEPELYEAYKAAGSRKGGR